MTTEAEPRDLPLHRSLLRAAVLAPACGVPAVLGVWAVGLRGLPPLLQLTVGFTGWAALLVVAGDLAGAGPWWRRGLVLFAAPALLPMLLLTVLIQIDRGRFDRESAWEAPYRAFEALTSKHLAWGVALLLASVVPFVAVLCCRAAPRRRPLWAHAAVILLSGYAGLLVFEHLARGLEHPLSHGRSLLLVAGSLLAILLTLFESRLAVAPREGLRELTGRAPARTRGWGRDAVVLVLAFALLALVAGLVYPVHYGARLEARAQGGDDEALERLTWEDRFRFLRAFDSDRWPERAAACRLLSRIPRDHSGDDPYEVMADDLTGRLEKAVRDTDPHVRLEARLAWVTWRAYGVPSPMPPPVDPADALALSTAERLDLARRAFDHARWFPRGMNPGSLDYLVGVAGVALSGLDPAVLPADLVKFAGLAEDSPQ